MKIQKQKGLTLISFLIVLSIVIFMTFYWYADRSDIPGILFSGQCNEWGGS